MFTNKIPCQVLEFDYSKYVYPWWTFPIICCFIPSSPFLFLTTPLRILHLFSSSRSPLKLLTFISTASTLANRSVHHLTTLPSPNRTSQGSSTSWRRPCGLAQAGPCYYRCCSCSIHPADSSRLGGAWELQQRRRQSIHSRPSPHKPGGGRANNKLLQKNACRYSGGNLSVIPVILEPNSLSSLCLRSENPQAPSC